MKKYILALTAAATLLGACEVDDKYYGKEVVDPAEKLKPAYGEDWTAHADKIDEKLIENFMNTDRGTFWYTDQDRTNESTYCYWPQAHAMDVLIDAYLRIPEGDARRDTYAGYMSKWYENKGNNYGNSYWGTYGFGNAYTDDIYLTGKGITFFNIGQTELSPKEKLRLDIIATQIKNAPKNKIYVIEGHADPQTGSKAVNTRLAEQRAKKVYDYLISKGVKAENLQYKGYSDTKSPFKTEQENRVTVIR